MPLDTTTGPARSFLFVLGSSRPGGNSEILAREAAAHLPAGVPRRWIDLNQLDLPDFRDGRHDTGDREPGKDEELLREATLEATDLVVVSPLYWYSVSAQTKRYLDHWSGWLNAPHSDFKERMAGGTLWGVTALGHDEHEVADGLTTTLHHSAAYLRMHFGGVLLGTANRPGRIHADERALTRARTFFEEPTPLALFPHEEKAGAVA
ncbi:flavodoxin family protein [Streptomyces hydrogenans]|uniref:flavodoxin family protein n=1 Tax=Streptomyces hydrogenans TaxID=1873719 RepID=UPI0035D9633A